jgi:type VI secretion system secreted protein VgrG
MAQLTESRINIKGRNITQFSSFTLTQSIFEHHTFRLVCPAESIDGKTGSILNQSKELIGAEINIQINTVGGSGKLNFAGVVTQVEAAKFSGHAGEIIITGYSPTILLDSGPHCKSWEKKALKNIATDCLSHFPQNLLNPKISPSHGETLSYTVQYKETAWQFLNRMGATYGDWFYYNGKNVVLGAPAGNEVKLTFGANLSRFNMSLQVRPPNFQLMAYDYMNNEVYDSSPKGIEGLAGLDERGQHTYNKSKEFFASQPKQWNNHFLTNKKQLDDYTNTIAAAQSSNMVRFNGASGHPGVQIANTIDVKGNNVFSGSNEEYGKFTVISVTHHTDGQGNYTNDFLAIPKSVKKPPVTAYVEPHCETQSAIVTDNHDPKGLGRVRVRFHWMKPSEKTPWIRITSPHGGGGKGMFFIPETGEEAIICFEGNSAVKPFVNGTVYHGKAKTDFSNAGNDVKALQTRSGNQMVMNDKDGSVYVSDKGGANTMMDGAGNITTNANVNSMLNAGNQSSINVGAKDGAPPQAFVTMDAGGNIVIDSKTSITIRVGGNVITISKEGITTTAADGDITTTADTGAINKKAKTMISINSDEKINVTALENLTMHGTADTVISGGEVKINS